MSREMKVEMRKLLMRWDFYVAGILLIGITSFFMYQLTADGAFVKIEGSEPIELTLSTVIVTIFSMSHHVGLIAIILAILCWSTLGKEADQRSMTTYFLHSSDKWKLMLGKIAVISIAVSILFCLSQLVMFAIYLIYQPGQIQFAGAVEDYQLLGQSLCLMILGAILFISLAAVVTLSFGSIGVLAATVGLAILSSIFRNNRYVKDFLPLNLLDTIEMQSFIGNAGLLVLYIAIVQLILWIYAKKREIGV